jgi:hypothetical protein
MPKAHLLHRWQTANGEDFLIEEDPYENFFNCLTSSEELTRLPFWSGRRVSNSRPQPWQGCALPTELLPHRVFGHANYLFAFTADKLPSANIYFTDEALKQNFINRLLAAKHQQDCHLEREKSLELSTSTLARLRSTN